VSAAAIANSQHEFRIDSNRRVDPVDLVGLAGYRIVAEALACAALSEQRKQSRLGLGCDRRTPSSSHGIERGSSDGTEKHGGVLERNGVAPWLGATHASPYGAAP
jgi:hypothetical protein